MPGTTSVFYTASARKDLKKLEKRQAKKIVLAVARYTQKDPLRKARALRGIFQGLFRYRVGEYRVIFEYDRGGVLYIVTVLRIKHRKEVYEK